MRPGSFYYCGARVQAGHFFRGYDLEACFYCREEWWLAEMVANEFGDIVYGLPLDRCTWNVSEGTW